MRGLLNAIKDERKDRTNRLLTALRARADSDPEGVCHAGG
jgi:hypothetical protein